jgi:transcriptional regulator with XRE-family HTH domain
MMPVQATALPSVSAIGATGGTANQTGAARQRTPNFQLRSWRDRAQMTRNELADAINQSPTGHARKLFCDEERIRRWEAGEVLCPSADYRKALHEVTGHDPHELGFRPRHQMFKGLRELREERGWSQAQALRALYACATPEEKKGLPGPDSLLRQYKRWEAGEVEPDGGRAEPFYKPIIARMFGTMPETIFPPRPATHGRTSRPVASGNLRDELESRRNLLRQAITKLQAELDYLTVILAVPVPGTTG